MPSPKYRELRHLVQLRDTHVQQLTATKCRIKALLLYEGIPFPSDAGKEKQWSARVLDELLELPCSETVRFKLDQLIGTLHFNFNAAAAAQKQIRLLLSKGCGTAAVDRLAQEPARHRGDRRDASGGPPGRSSSDYQRAADCRAFSAWSRASIRPATNRIAVRLPARATAGCATS